MYKHLYILILNLISLSSMGQILVGAVTDNNKQILPGANITIEGQNKGISSDIEGKFSAIRLRIVIDSIWFGDRTFLFLKLSGMNATKLLG